LTQKGNPESTLKTKTKSPLAKERIHNLKERLCT